MSEKHKDGSADELKEPKGIEHAKIEELEAKLNEAEAKVNEYWNKILYMQAEHDNVQRRSEKTIADAHKYALDRFIPELLQVVDSLEKTLETAHTTNEIQALRDGTKLTLDLLLKALQKAGVEVVDPAEQAFNPELHQAMTMVEKEGVQTWESLKHGTQMLRNSSLQKQNQEF